jgi:siroheme synthase (precorrin-2 oxidase/ferrochelatase)
MPERVYAVGLRIKGRRVLVVGGGAVAARKVAGLIEAGASVVVVAPQISSDDLRARITAHEVTWEARTYEAYDVDGAALVFAATSDSAVNRAVQRDATERGVLANIADAPELCDFDVPSSFARDVAGSSTEPGDGESWSASLQVAVFTGGASPAFAALMRREIERAQDPAHLALFRLVVRLRRILPVAMRPLLSRIAAPDVLAKVAARDESALRQHLAREVGSRVSPAALDDLVSEALS